jgi:CheY-like chemotaxis protein
LPDCTAEFGVDLLSGFCEACGQMRQSAAFIVVFPAIVLSLAVSGGLTVAADDLRYSAAGDGTTSLFQFPPDTPEELVEAVRIAIRLDRPSDARGFLRQLIERDPQAPEMLAYRQRHGLATLIDFRRDARLLPESAQLLKQMLGALPQLSTAELAERATLLGTGLSAADVAEFDLMAAGTASMPVLLNQTTSTTSGRAAANLLETFALDWRHDLAALLPAADASTRLRIYGLLAGSAAHDLEEILLRQQFTATVPAEAAAARAALRRLARGAEIPETADAAVEHLLKLAEASLLEAGTRTLAPDPAVVATGQPADELPPIRRASLLIEHALAIQPAHPQGVLLRQVIAAATAPLNVPANGSGTDAGDLQLAVLNVALELGQAPAAISILKTLDPNTLKAGSLEEPAGTVLRQALASPDARVRTLAAALALRAGLENRASAKAVRRQIATAASRAPRPEAVVVLADAQQRLRFKHLMEDQGFQVDAAGTGPDGFLAAAAQLQCEYVLLSLQPSQWSPAMTMANLRADPRTRLATVILVGPQAAREQAEGLIETYGNAVFLEEPVGPLTFASRLGKLRLPAPVVSAAERQQLRQDTGSLLSGP